MPLEEEQPRPPKSALEIGGDISALSESEIEERIEHLQSEIERLRASLSSKRASRAAADAFFKK